MKHKISVLMPTYNRIHWLATAMDSVLEPGLDLELIVLDNGSSDGTWPYLKERALQEPRLRVVRWNENNPGESYPFLLGQARGEYVNFFADDDEMLPGGLARKLAALEQHPELGMVFGAVRTMDAEGRDRGEAAWTVIAQEDVLGPRDFFAELMQSNFVPMPAAMFRRALAPPADVLRENRYSPSHDWQFWLHLLRRNRAGYLREPTVRLRLHGDQVSNTLGFRKGMFIDVNLNVWRHWMLEQDPPFVPDARNWQRMVQNLAGVLQETHGQDRARFQEGLGRLQALKDEQDAALAKAQDAREAPFREAFLVEADWTGEAWKADLLAYASAFRAGDPVLLAFLLDPARPGEPAPAEAEADVARELARTGWARLPEVRVLGPDQLLEVLRTCPHLQWCNRGGLEGVKGRRLAAALQRDVDKVRP